MSVRPFTGTVRPFAVDVPRRTSTSSGGGSLRCDGPAKKRPSTTSRRAFDSRPCRRSPRTGPRTTGAGSRRAQRAAAVPDDDRRSRHPLHPRALEARHALPIIVTHGWPGSVVEQLKIIGPLTDPTAHGGSAEDAFDVVIPSLPGYGFSGKPTDTGWDPPQIARAWAELMERLGYGRYVAQGGDWGNAVTERWPSAPDGVAGIHTNMPATFPENREGPPVRRPSPARSPADERRAWDQLDFFYKHGLGYANEMAADRRRCTARDSPVGLAAWMLDHDARSHSLIARVFDGQAEGLTKDDILDNVDALLVDEDGGLVGSPVLGEQARVLRPRGCRPAGRGQRLPGRDLRSSAQLGGGRLSRT